MSRIDARQWTVPFYVKAQELEVKKDSAVFPPKREEEVLLVSVEIPGRWGRADMWEYLPKGPW